MPQVLCRLCSCFRLLLSFNLFSFSLISVITVLPACVDYTLLHGQFYDNTATAKPPGQSRQSCQTVAGDFITFKNQEEYRVMKYAISKFAILTQKEMSIQE